MALVTVVVLVATGCTMLPMALPATVLVTPIPLLLSGVRISFFVVVSRVAWGFVWVVVVLRHQLAFRRGMGRFGSFPPPVRGETRKGAGSGG